MENTTNNTNQEVVENKEVEVFEVNVEKVKQQEEKTTGIFAKVKTFFLGGGIVRLFKGLWDKVIGKFQGIKNFFGSFKQNGFKATVKGLFTKGNIVKSLVGAGIITASVVTIIGLCKRKSN